MGILMLAFTGCATFERPEERPSITALGKESSQVRLTQIRVQSRKGVLELAGTAFPSRSTNSTTWTHLDLSFFDKDGKPLGSAQRQLPPQKQSNPRSLAFQNVPFYYALSDMPEGTLRIDVQAHEGADHPTAR
jgi:hypothetical protein